MSFFYAFHEGTIAPAGFHHRQHLALAVCFASLMPLEDAVDAFRADLLRHVRAWGHEEKYHETITRFWLTVAAHHVKSCGPEPCLAHVASEFVERFDDKTMIERHYSRAVLASAAARAGFVEPDLLPLPV
jgi:hypothetical protein